MRVFGFCAGTFPWSLRRRFVFPWNFLLLFAEGRATEIEIPLSLDRLVGMEAQGNFYFERRGPRRELIKARLVGK